MPRLVVRRFAWIGVVMLAGVACRPKAEPIAESVSPRDPSPAPVDASAFECAPEAGNAQRTACTCGEVDESLRPLCAAMIAALQADDASAMARHTVGEIHVRGCVDRSCTDTLYRDAAELGDAVATAGGFRKLLGLEGERQRLRIRHCPQCRNNQLLSVCVSPAAADDEACLGGEGHTLRSILTRGRAPEVDADGDDIAIGRDHCPREAESYNSVEDDDGCPDALEASSRPQPARIRIDRSDDTVVLGRPLEFEGDRATLSRQGVAVLGEVAAYLRARPDRSLRIHLHIEVDPHPHAAVPLANERADAIRKLLVERGVEPERVLAVPTTDTTTGPAPKGPIAQTLKLMMD